MFDNAFLHLHRSETRVPMEPDLAPSCSADRGAHAVHGCDIGWSLPGIQGTLAVTLVTVQARTRPLVRQAAKAGAFVVPRPRLRARVQTQASFPLDLEGR